MDRPIIFSAPMVRALLAGRKTQTRRPIEPEEAGTPLSQGSILVTDGGGFVRQVVGHFRPRWGAGDRLWVKEATRRAPHLWVYDADGAEVPWPGRQAMATWTRDTGAAMYLPRAASRITLIVERVRIERLQDISCADAIAEGIAPVANSETIDCDTPDPREDYRSLWSIIHGKDAWDANPWVAAISFRVILANIDAPPANPLATGEAA